VPRKHLNGDGEGDGDLLGVINLFCGWGDPIIPGLVVFPVMTCINLSFIHQLKKTFSCKFEEWVSTFSQHNCKKS
jgi:hypothetical protein